MPNRPLGERSLGSHSASHPLAEATDACYANASAAPKFLASRRQAVRTYALHGAAPPREWHHHRAAHMPSSSGMACCALVKERLQLAGALYSQRRLGLSGQDQGAGVVVLWQQSLVVSLLRFFAPRTCTHTDGVAQGRWSRWVISDPLRA